jgi:hypothetical protein
MQSGRGIEELIYYSFAYLFEIWMPISLKSMHCESVVVSFFRSSIVCTALRVTLSLKGTKDK